MTGTTADYDWSTKINLTLIGCTESVSLLLIGGLGYGVQMNNSNNTDVSRKMKKTDRMIMINDDWLYGYIC